MPTPIPGAGDSRERIPRGCGAGGDEQPAAPRDREEPAKRRARGRWWPRAAALAVAATVAAGAYAGYRIRQERAAEATLQAACGRDDPHACSTLCERTPPVISACLQLGITLDSAAVDDRDAKRSTQLFAQACRAGEQEGCARLGRAQYIGIGTERNLEQARINLEGACHRGNALGCTGYGHLLMTGQAGVKLDQKRGLKLFRDTCTRGELRGCTLLATAYLNAQGVERDEERAYTLFEDACQRGLDRACVGKAAMEFDARGNVKRDEPGAVSLFERACNGKAKEGCAYLAVAYLFGRGVAKDPTRGIAALRKACNQAPPAGCAALGELYVTGQVPNPHPSAAAESFQRACDYGQPEGCLAIAQAMLSGSLGLPQNQGRAVELTRGACAQGSPPGCTQLAALELEGVGPLTRNVPAAKRRAAAACSSGHAPACTLLAGIYAQGLDGTPNQAQAHHYFEQGCKGGDGNGCAFSGAQLIDGQGVKKDVPEGVRRLAESCERWAAPQGCALYARALLLGADGRSGMKRGVQLAEAMCLRGELQSCVMAAAGHLEARGVPRDMARGARLVVTACRAGFPPACAIQKRLPSALISTATKALEQAAANAATANPTPAPPPPFPLGAPGMGPNPRPVLPP